MPNRAEPHDRWVGTALLTAGVVLAASLAWRTASTPTPDIVASVTAGVLDIVVGLAFVVGGAVSPGAAWERMWMGATGLAWMIATWLPSLSGVHQGLLLAAIALFASGIPRTAVQRAASAVCVLLALGIWSQLVVAGAFALAAALTVSGGTARRRRNALTAVAAALVAATLAASWTATRLDPATFRPVAGLRLYEASLIAAAALLAVGMLRANRPGAMTDTFLAADTATGLDGLERLLRDALNDPVLRIVPRGDGAAVVSASPLLEDFETRQAVDSAVALAARHAALTSALDRQRLDLEAAGRRLLTSVDRRRTVVARRLRSEVLAPLADAERRLRAARAGARGSDRIAAIDIALHEVESARSDVLGMVRGIPPVALGGGRISAALERLAASAGPTVTIRVDPQARGDEAAELAVFYVCSEALANALRHAEASTVTVMLSTDATHLSLVVRDDGRGGARPESGSGLEGLADRVAASGGELRIDSGRDGTTVAVQVPVRSPASTAPA